MSGSNPPAPREHPRGATVMAAFESYLLAELVWYILRDGEDHLYEYVVARIPAVCNTVIHWLQVLQTLHSIRRLPER